VISRGKSPAVFFAPAFFVVETAQSPRLLARQGLRYAMDFQASGGATVIVEAARYRGSGPVRSDGRVFEARKKKVRAILPCVFGLTGFDFPPLRGLRPYQGITPCEFFVPDRLLSVTRWVRRT
jgi:hypothetical protein